MVPDQVPRLLAVLRRKDFRRWRPNSRPRLDFTRPAAHLPRIH